MCQPIDLEDIEKIRNLLVVVQNKDGSNKWHVEGILGKQVDEYQVFATGAHVCFKQTDVHAIYDDVFGHPLIVLK